LSKDQFTDIELKTYAIVPKINQRVNRIVLLENNGESGDNYATMPTILSISVALSLFLLFLDPICHKKRKSERVGKREEKKESLGEREHARGSETDCAHACVCVYLSRSFCLYTCAYFYGTVLYQHQGINFF